jgi:hypothetical protein
MGTDSPTPRTFFVKINFMEDRKWKKPSDCIS